ncbi:LamB/YcsF family protein [Shouchella sp. JSM 1781072]|uniref:LamB/YcsF family protein n=1 Tax=Bacillaceae TaxID=186817 RepID=UPI000C075201|nr:MULTISPECIES: 5-oxoprolinase subunit PxpA [Bacillaceae]UTR06770.1 LamB/YcsF family protein [Alkalihalobacillus sp. LMS6]
MNKTVDLNSDMGESFGAYTMGNDSELMTYISSANVACGFHAGDPKTMRATVQRALASNVAIGAHPGLQDLMGFGRRPMEITPDEGYDLVLYQIGALLGMTQAEGGKLHHVKPHGALYNMAAKNKELALAVAKAVYKLDASLVLYGLAGSALIDAGREVGLQTASEVFADRTYQLDGSLTSRRSPDAMIVDANQASKQVLRMVQEGKVMTQQGKEIDIEADTICIHGDGAHALAFAKEIHAKIQESGITIKRIKA